MDYKDKAFISNNDLDIPENSKNKPELQSSSKIPEVLSKPTNTEKLNKLKPKAKFQSE